MDSRDHWTPSPLRVEPLASLAPLESTLPCVSLQGATKGGLGEMEGDFCSSARCEEEEEDEAGLSSGPWNETRCSMKASFVPPFTSSVDDSPQSSDVYDHDTLCAATKASLAREETNAVQSPSESSNCRGFGDDVKRPKVEQSGLSTKAPGQVRKLGEKITALQQLVSPFGKTDTGSVLLEAIGYIKFLQDQVHVLSSPYMIAGSSRKESQSRKDLRSRGLCLVPISCTLNVASSNGADYWISGSSGCSRNEQDDWVLV